MRSLRFDNRFVAELPADPVSGAGIREVRGALYSHVNPTPVAEPQLLAWSREVAGLIGLDDADVASPEFARIPAPALVAPVPDTNVSNIDICHKSPQSDPSRQRTDGGLAS